MQFLEGGASGPNGQSRTDQSPGETPAAEGPRGSLMSRYRNATPPDPAGPTDAVIPPAPRTGDAGPAAAPLSDNPWRDPGTSSWSATPPSPPAPPAPPVAPAAVTPPTPAVDEPVAEPAADPLNARQPAVAEPARPATPTAAAPAPAAPVAAAPTTPAAPAPAAEPAGVTVTRGTAPGAASPKSVGMLTEDQTSGYKRRWRDVQGDFVDDPQQAVRDAGVLAREVLDALAGTIADPTRVEAWKAGDGSGATEDLRVALRQYRTLVDRLLEL